MLTPASLVIPNKLPHRYLNYRAGVNVLIMRQEDYTIYFTSD